MAAKKYYAVKKGKSTGIFSTWEECKAAVEGYSGARFKGFATRMEAERYLEPAPEEKKQLFEAQAAKAQAIKAQEVEVQVAGAQEAEVQVAEVQEAEVQAAEAQEAEVQAAEAQEAEVQTVETQEVEVQAAEAQQPACRLLAYVDGSYDDRLKKYAFGCVFILDDGTVYTECGNGDNPQSLQHRNVTGEMLGAMYAVKTAMFNGFSSVEICYDYQGLEKWVTGEWRARTYLTGKYAAAMREWERNIEIIFTKVAAHTNVKFNELADRTAKRGLTEAAGVPKVRKLTEFNQYREETETL